MKVNLSNILIDNKNLTINNKRQKLSAMDVNKRGEIALGTN